MNKDLKRLLELEKQRHDKCNETEWLKWHDDYEDVKSKLNEKLEKYDMITSQPCHENTALAFLQQEQQIKQLKRQLENECKNTENWRVENNNLKSQNEKLQKVIDEIREIDFEELFEFKSDDIKLKDYFPLVYAKLKSILSEVEK